MYPCEVMVHVSVIRSAAVQADNTGGSDGGWRGLEPTGNTSHGNTGHGNTGHVCAPAHRDGGPQWP